MSECVSEWWGRKELMCVSIEYRFLFHYCFDKCARARGPEPAGLRANEIAAAWHCARGASARMDGRDTYVREFGCVFLTSLLLFFNGFTQLCSVEGLV